MVLLSVEVDSLPPTNTTIHHGWWCCKVVSAVNPWRKERPLKQFFGTFLNFGFLGGIVFAIAAGFFLALRGWALAFGQTGARIKAVHRTALNLPRQTMMYDWHSGRSFCIKRSFGETLIFVYERGPDGAPAINGGSGNVVGSTFRIRRLLMTMPWLITVDHYGFKTNPTGDFWLTAEDGEPSASWLRRAADRGQHIIREQGHMLRSGYGIVHGGSLDILVEQLLRAVPAKI